MSGKGKLSGFAWHNEYHAEPKKDKVADCIYLDGARICNNKKCYYYLSKCFDATHCSRREKAKINNNNSTQYKSNKKPIKKCSLPIGCKITHKNGMTGRFTEYDQNKGYIIIEYPDRKAKYLYPQAFINNFLSLPDKLLHLLQKDIAKYQK